jgi:uncharacterized protein YkwD
MKRVYAPIALLALLLGLVSFGAGGLRAAPASFLVYLPMLPTVGSDGQTLAQHQMAVDTLDLINQQRASHGCGPLSLSSKLTAAAQGQSRDMAELNFFNHTNPDASRATPGQRASAAGYSWSMVGENIAAGYADPSAVVSGWMSSSGHRANILNCSYTETGIGYYYQANDQPFDGSGPFFHYWTQVFARP